MSYFTLPTRNLSILSFYLYPMSVDIKRIVNGCVVLRDLFKGAEIWNRGELKSLIGLLVYYYLRKCKLRRSHHAISQIVFPFMLGFIFWVFIL